MAYQMMSSRDSEEIYLHRDRAWRLETWAKRTPAAETVAASGYRRQRYFYGWLAACSGPIYALPRGLMPGLPAAQIGHY